MRSPSSARNRYAGSGQNQRLILDEVAFYNESPGNKPIIQRCEFEAQGPIKRVIVDIIPEVRQMGKSVLNREAIDRAKAPAWRDCPAGTVAYSHTGTNWTKQEDGRWRANGGDAFPTPGADALLVRLPKKEGQR